MLQEKIVHLLTPLGMPRQDHEQRRHRELTANMAKRAWQELGRRLRSGDAGAFEELLREHHASVYRLAKRLVRNEEDAKEITQESFLAAYEGMAGYRGDASPASWLLSIVYNKSVDRLKRNRRFDPLPDDDFESDTTWQKMPLVGNLTDRIRNPEQNFLDGQLRTQLEAALLRVPPDSRAVFELRELQGLSAREVAAVLNISEAAVRVRLHRVRQYLISQLQRAFDRTV